LPSEIFAHKVILPLATSHTIAHISALEYSLKPVLKELGATQILPSVFAVDNQLQDAEHSNLEIAIRLQATLQDLLQAIATNKGTKPNNSSSLLDEIYAVH
jgi:FMN reductase